MKELLSTNEGMASASLACDSLSEDSLAQQPLKSIKERLGDREAGWGVLHITFIVKDPYHPSVLAKNRFFFQLNK